MGPRRKAKPGRKDVAAEITQRIVAELEKGVMPWRCNWRKAGVGVPRRHNGELYRGINFLMLELTAHTSGYSSPFWMTYNQARGYGAQVRKGEKGTSVVYYGSATAKTAEHDAEGTQGNDDDAATYRFLKGYTVFNSLQIDGLPAHFLPDEVDLDAGGRPIERLQAFFDRIPVPVRLGGDVAAYRQRTDDIVMPAHCRFESGELWAATLGHECAHATGTEHRLNRPSLVRYHESVAIRATEELVAELSAAILGAHLGFAGDHITDHAAYLGGWLKVMKQDARYILKAAAEAQRAVDWLFDAAGWAPQGDVIGEAA